ncbi:RDD family protein [Kitasatospora sp. NPDC018619]|uniref:RDD family protein n=1 Tax=unclassified Kitasatospora TaxID=2633591 RepID=UPI0037966597
MTDRPFAADGDPAVAPGPGYYPDPSIPGFVRYWGGSSWVPGTSRPAPAEGEVLRPPRYATRRPAPDGGPAARTVPPPVAPAAGTAGPGVEAVPEAVAQVQAGLPAGGGDTGPVYLDQTSGGASFVLGPRVAEVIGGPVFRTVDGPGVASGGPSGVSSGLGGGGRPVGGAGAAEAAGVVEEPPAGAAVPGVDRPPMTSPVPSSVPSPGGGAAPVAAAGESGWQADPRAQRGLMETGDAPRWVSWGVLPEALEAEEGRAEPERAPVAVELAAAGAPAVATAVREAPVPAVLASGPVPVVGERAVPAAAPARGPARGPAAAAATAAVPARQAPLPAVRTARGTAVQPRPSAVAAPASTRASRTARTTRIATPAGLGRRLAARAVDTVVLLVVAVAAGIPLGRSVSDHLQQKVDQARMASALTRRQVQVWLVDDVVLGKVGVLIGILLFVSLLYEVLPVARTGQTFGKRLARIRVVDAASPAARTRLSLGRSLLRWVVRQLGAVLLLGLVWPVFDRTARRGWQDRAARTRVVRG